MEQNLINDDLIRQLCSIHDEAMSRQRPAMNGEKTRMILLWPDFV